MSGGNHETVRNRKCFLPNTYVKTAMVVRFGMAGLNGPKYVTSLLARSNSHMFPMSSSSSVTNGLRGFHFPWTRLSMEWHSSQRSLRASQRGDSEGRSW